MVTILLRTTVLTICIFLYTVIPVESYIDRKPTIQYIDALYCSATVNPAYLLYSNSTFPGAGQSWVRAWVTKSQIIAPALRYHHVDFDNFQPRSWSYSSNQWQCSFQSVQWWQKAWSVVSDEPRDERWLFFKCKGPAKWEISWMFLTELCFPWPGHIT